MLSKLIAAQPTILSDLPHPLTNSKMNEPLQNHLIMMRTKAAKTRFAKKAFLALSPMTHLSQRAKAQVKLLGLDTTTKAYKDLKVNCHQLTQRKRLVCWAEGSGRILISTYIPDDVKAKVTSKPSSVKFKGSSLVGFPALFVTRTKELAEAKGLAAAMNA